jgi:hypothetical protein
VVFSLNFFSRILEASVKEPASFLSSPFSLVVYYFKHGLTATFWRLLFMAVVRVRAVATLVVSFNFLAAFFALKRWHCSSQQNITEKHNNFTREGLHIKATDGIAVNGAEAD